MEPADCPRIAVSEGEPMLVWRPEYQRIGRHVFNDKREERPSATTDGESPLRGVESHGNPVPSGDPCLNGALAQPELKGILVAIRYESPGLLLGCRSDNGHCRECNTSEGSQGVAATSHDSNIPHEHFKRNVAAVARWVGVGQQTVLGKGDVRVL
jgi:hypothetical protein